MSDNAQEKILTPAQQRALVAAVSIFLDNAFDDLAGIIKGESFDDTIFDECLPSQFRHHYNVLFLKRFLVCAIRVADRIADWDGWTIPACTAECLALRAIVHYAEAVLDSNNEEDSDLDIFVDAAFPDLDIEILFEQALDGFENTEIAKELGMFIKPTQWFLPAYGDIHPYCE